MSFRRPAILAAATLATTALTAGILPAHADDSSLAPRTTFTMPVDETTGNVTPPTSGEAIPNVDSVKSAIHAYYAVPNNSAGYSTQIANPTSSPYITEVAAKEAEIAALPALSGGDIGTKAVVFDTDDTLLWNYNYEDLGSNFNYDPTSNAQWVTGKSSDTAQPGSFNCGGVPKTGNFCFPAVPGMPALVKGLAAKGYRLYIITGRPASQKQATFDNLVAAGFVDGSDPLFSLARITAKDLTTQPWVHADYDGNAASTSTVEYKALTRKNIETTDGVDIVANVGDQLSDLWGGYADTSVKIPNPTYFLSSPDLTSAYAGADDVASLPAFNLPDTYAMNPDSIKSGLASTTGDGIPNIDPVRAEIRAFYGVDTTLATTDPRYHTANKTKSPYITEVTGLEKTWTDQIITSCQTQLTKIGAANTSVASAATAVTRANSVLGQATKKATKAKKAVKKAHGTKAKKKAKRKLRTANRAVTTAASKLATAKATLAGIKVPGKPAVVFDSDDTTLWNYDMEDGAMKFVFNTGLQNDWVQGEQMLAVPGMPQLVARIADAGCTVVGLTGRSNDQKYATLGNLVKDGYTDFSRDLFFTKWYDQNDATAARIAAKPAYLTCTVSPTCSTVEFKSQTRKHLQDDLGYQIVANVGDQFSDLQGGYADATYKVPNPTYYLP